MAKGISVQSKPAKRGSGKTSNDPVPSARIRLLNSIFKEYLYRHSLFWKLVFRFVSSIAILLAVPFYRNFLDPKIADYAAVFPLFAIALSLSSSWILLAERSRMAASINAHRTLRDTLLGEADVKGFDQEPPFYLRTSIAKFIALSIAIVGTMLALVALSALGWEVPIISRLF